MAAFLALLAAVAPSAAVGQIESPPVGFSIVNLEPGNGTTAQLTFKAPQYLCGVEHQATSTALSASALVDTAATWTDDLYNGSNGPHYLEIVKVGGSTTNPAVGTRRDIADTVESSRSLIISEPWPSGLSSPVTYRIVKHWTIRQLFGSIKQVGVANTITDSSLVDATANWAADEFNGENGPHFVEIVSINASTTAPHVGTRREIIDTDPVTRTLTVDQPWPSSLSAPATYRIVRHMASRSNTSGNLREGSPLSADSFQLWDGERYETYYYQTEGIGGKGWRKAGDQFTEAGDTIIQLGQAIIFSRGETSPLSLVVRGVVKDGVTPLSIHLGFNFLANPYASQMTLGSCALFTGSAATGIASGSLLTADQVLVWNGVFYDTYYHQASGLGGVGWRKVGNLYTDASSTIIPAASSIIIRRLDSRSFTWRVPAHPVQP